ncbi:MAG: hypothetical protein DYG98_23065 [Haliscomenobacteraceae bacterium CHB4]|nr:hypothetical protein [Haliscomenobacteraceae bacterium CHB4]
MIAYRYSQYSTGRFPGGRKGQKSCTEYNGYIPAHSKRLFVFGKRCLEDISILFCDTFVEKNLDNIQTQITLCHDVK